MRAKKIIIIALMCIAASVGIIVVKNRNISEEKAFEILMKYDLEIYGTVNDYQILGRDYNGMVEIESKKYYKFSFMEKSSNESSGNHIVYNFVVSVDGNNVYKYDVVSDSYLRLQKRW